MCVRNGLRLMQTKGGREDIIFLVNFLWTPFIEGFRSLFCKSGPYQMSQPLDAIIKLVQTAGMDRYASYRQMTLSSLQYIDTVCWATGRATGLQKVVCWFVGGGGDFTQLCTSYSSSCHHHLHYT